MLLFYALTIFVSATLLFVVQPMFARMVLPLLGGSPAVWNTALVFYQAVLLAGYGYAHVLTSRLTPRRQVLVHLGVLLLPLLVLPISVPAGWVPPRAQNPTLWLLALLSVAVGLPFFAVSASSPLLQTWFSRTRHHAAKDPYFLYVASNLGSMLSLLSYPFLLEPTIALRQQSWLWAAGFGVLIVLIGGCGLAVWRSLAPVEQAAAEAPTVPPAPLTWRRRLRWVALSAVPASLMMSVTTYMSTDLASIPLLWIVPLALYLLTFVLVFATRPPISHRLMVWALPPFVLVLSLAMQITEPIIVMLPVHLLTFWIVTMVAHGELAADRPDAQHLTQFYLLLSLGGVIGGIFNALVAPVIFTSVVEYPLTLVLACLLLPQRGDMPPLLRGRTWDVALPVLAWALVIVGAQVVSQFTVSLFGLGVVYSLPALLSFSQARRPLRFALCVGTLLVTSSLMGAAGTHVLYAERSFFGVNRVLLDEEHGRHTLIHGTTLHGVQKVGQGDQKKPLSYYYPTGPAGQVFSALPNHPELRRIAVVGLGAGALTCYATREQTWTLYEIDSVVVDIATNPAYFTYVPSCVPQARVELGDARLSLESAPDQSFDVMVMDAYSSDAIPVHLITREALQLYLRKLSPQGILLFHLTNRHLDLEPALDNLARDASLAAALRKDLNPSAEELADGKHPSQWAIMARTPQVLQQLGLDDRWQPLRSEPGSRLWTDDYSSIVQALRWRR